VNVSKKRERLQLRSTYPPLTTMSSPSRKKHILIVGAGIAGLCFALQILTHAHEFYTLTIFEKVHPPAHPLPEMTLTDLRQAPAPDPDTGFCIILPPNAVRILRDLGIDLVAEDCATPLTHTCLHSGTGEKLLEAHGVFPGDPTSLLTVERGKFVALLLRLVAEKGGSVQWGRKVIDVVSDSEGVEVHFLGAESRCGDLCVGADGTWSGVRRALYSRTGHAEHAWRPQPTRWTALYGISPVDGPEGMLRLYLRHGKPGAYATYSLAHGRVFWICYESSTPSPAPPHDAEQTITEFSSLPYGTETFGEVMQRTGKTRKVRLWHSVFDTISDSHGKVVLIGDSAHPQTTFVGQGAARGIEEGAELLRGLLRLAWGAKGEFCGEEMGVGFFVSAAKGRSRRVARTGWWAGAAVMGDWWWSRWIRDAVLWWISRAERKREEKIKAAKEKKGYGGTLEDGKEKRAVTKPQRTAQKDQQKRQKHWLLDYHVPSETEAEFWEGIRAAREGTRQRGEKNKGTQARARGVLTVSMLSIALLWVVGMGIFGGPMGYLGKHF
jgi:2-polyprenyl-6-methoxyphenol hydroxylase-like FAD-dependent oxidoreductase